MIPQVPRLKLRLCCQPTAILLLFILLGGFFLRIHGLEWGLPNQNSYLSYKTDENIFIRSISQMKPAQLDFNPHFFVWGCWHFYELAFVLKMGQSFGWIKVVSDKGFYFQHPEEMAKIYQLGRWLSVFFSIGTLWLVFAVGRKIRNVKTGLLGILFLAIMPAHVINSHFLTADASVTFWATLVLFFSIRILDSGQWADYIGAGVALAFAAGAKHTGAFVAGTLFFAHLLRQLNQFSWHSLIQAFFCRKLWYAYLTSAFVYLISNPYMILAFEEAKPHLLWLLSQGGASNVESRQSFFLDALRLFSVGMTWPFLWLFLFSLLSFFGRFRKPTLLIFLWMLPFLTHMLKSGLLATRFQMFILPAVCILMADAVSSWLEFLRFKKLQLIKGFMVLILVLSVLYTSAYVFAYDRILASPPLQDVASQWLLQNLPKGTTIGVASEPFMERTPSVIHQDYFYSESDHWKPHFRIQNFDYDAEKLRQGAPEYFAISIRESSLNANPSDRHNPFIRALLDRYEPIRSFENKIELLGYEFKPSKVILSDWHLPLSTLSILRKKT